MERDELWKYSATGGKRWVPSSFVKCYLVQQNPCVSQFDRLINTRAVSFFFCSRNNPRIYSWLNLSSIDPNRPGVARPLSAEYKACNVLGEIVANLSLRNLIFSISFANNDPSTNSIFDTRTTDCERREREREKKEVPR